MYSIGAHPHPEMAGQNTGQQSPNSIESLQRDIGLHEYSIEDMFGLFSQAVSEENTEMLKRK